MNGANYRLPLDGGRLKFALFFQINSFFVSAKNFLSFNFQLFTFNFSLSTFHFQLFTFNFQISTSNTAQLIYVIVPLPLLYGTPEPEQTELTHSP